MLLDNFKATGMVSFVLTDENGNIKTQQQHNLVVNAGLAYIVARLADAVAPDAMTHMALGTGTTAAAAADQNLEAEIAGGRVTLDSVNKVTTTITNDSVQYVAIFEADQGTGAVTEAGIFNAETGGTMLARTVFDVINKGSGDTLTITWKITIAVPSV